MIIACYYGKLPDWLELWLLSCKYNPCFDFMLVTDQKVSNTFPANVRLLQLSMEELRRRFSRILGFSAALSDEYKLCDYKPLYGLAFQKELTGFDFWGHCDLDVIWGDLGKFIKEDLFEQHIRIGKFGHLTLYKNTEEVLRLYREPGAAFSFDTVFQDSSHYGFDEIMGMNRIFEKGGIPYYGEMPIADAMWLLPRITVYPGVPCSEVYFWHEGKVCRAYQQGENGYKVQEFAYLHFQKSTLLFIREQNMKMVFLSRVWSLNRFFTIRSHYRIFRGRVNSEAVLRIIIIYMAHR